MCLIDWSVQATVSWILSETFGTQNISIVAEEDVLSLSKPESANLLGMVVKTVNQCLSEAPRFGLKSPAEALGASQVLEAIEKCSSTGGPVGKHWVLDPIDGTVGFVRGKQYAVALALMDNGKIVVGVLGCPNYAMKKNWLVNHSQQYRVMPELSLGNPALMEEGCVLYTKRGGRAAWKQPLIHCDQKLVWPNSAKLIRVSSIEDPALATFCEPVEEANSNHSFTAGLANTVGFRFEILHHSLNTKFYANSHLLFFHLHTEYSILCQKQ